MANLGVHVYEQATPVSTPVVADVGIPYVVGLAPVHAAENPAKSNTPVIVTSWSEAVEKLGFSYDWKTYTLCEFIYSHFQLYGCQPVIFCNVFDPVKMRTQAEARDYNVIDRCAKIPFDMIADTLIVKNGETVLEQDEDYSILYDENKNACIIELLSTGEAYEVVSLNVSGYQVKTDEIVIADIVEVLGEIDSCMNTVGVIPDLICVPGFSHNSVVAAVMATKAAGINGLFRAKAIIDCDSGADGVRQYSDLIGYKNKKVLVGIIGPVV